MAEQNPERGEGRPRRARAKAIAGPRRRHQRRAGRAFDLVTLSLAIWLGVLVAAEGLQRLGEMTPDSGVASNLTTLQAAGG
jgi:hypothetical protein